LKPLQQNLHVIFFKIFVIHSITKMYAFAVDLNLCILRDRCMGNFNFI